MSRARSSRAAAVTLLALGLTACSHGPSGPSGTKASGVLGYVNMDALLKVHPLYGELSRMDADVEALQIKALGASVPRATGADLAREEKALQKELAAATDRTKKALHDKQDEYAKREQLAINAALAAAGGPPGPSGAAIAGGIARQSQVQGRSVAGAAQSDFDRYRRTLLEQNRQDLMAVQRALDDKASRTYRTKVEELQRKEADLSLSEAHADAAERLSLTTKLQNLALDDSSREDTRKQLAALNQKESDAVAALKNRDQATLASLQTQLHKQTSDELERRARDMNRQTAAKIDARGRQTQLALVNQIAQVPPGPQGGGVALPVNLPPDLRARLMTLHKKYQDDFSKDANKTIVDFEKTRDDLTKRFRALAGIDAGAQSGANRQIEALQKQRGELYDQMVAQIDREVKHIAEQRGINVVFSSILAPAGGVDLTADAEKDIESLHE